MSTSFANISGLNWQPTTTYQSVQTGIQTEVDQGLWDNDVHIDIWCTIAVSETQGVDNSWVTYTYRNGNDNSQSTVLWPAGWPAPAENKNGQLPSHFFVRRTSGGGTNPGGIAILVLSDVATAPTIKPPYKVAGTCI